MLFFIILFIGLPLAGWYLFTGVFDAVTGYKKQSYYKPEKTIINNYTTENHLHVHSKDFKDYLDKKLNS